MFRSVVAIAVITIACAASAQPTVSPAKNQLIQRLLQLWHVQNIGLTMLHAPIDDTLRQSRALLQGRTTADRQEAALKDINEYVAKFYEETTPVVLDSAQRLIPTTVVPILAAKFSEEELRQIIAILESPVKSKFEALIPEMQKALGEKVSADAFVKLSPRMDDLKKQIGTRLRTAVTP